MTSSRSHPEFTRDDVRFLDPDFIMQVQHVVAEMLEKAPPRSDGGKNNGTFRGQPLLIPISRGIGATYKWIRAGWSSRDILTLAPSVSIWRLGIQSPIYMIRPIGLLTTDPVSPLWYQGPLVDAVQRMWAHDPNAFSLRIDYVVDKGLHVFSPTIVVMSGNLVVSPGQFVLSDAVARSPKMDGYSKARASQFLHGFMEENMQWAPEAAVRRISNKFALAIEEVVAQIKEREGSCSLEDYRQYRVDWPDELCSEFVSHTREILNNLDMLDEVYRYDTSRVSRIINPPRVLRLSS